MKSLSIVPTYNERDNIKELIAAIRRDVSDPNFEILVVDSASTDGTADVVRELQKTDSRLHLITQPAKLGLGKAYLEGMQWVLTQGYDSVITMDADFSHHPRYIPQMLEEVKKVDVVVGSRYIPGGSVLSWPLRRLILSRVSNWVARMCTGIPLVDMTSGFQCFRTTFLKKVLENPIKTEGYAFLVELKLLSTILGAAFKEIPIAFNDRSKGKSKISKKVVMESILYVLRRYPKKHQVQKSYQIGKPNLSLIRDR